MDRSEYGGMRHRFNVENFLLDVARLKASFYPGMMAADAFARNYPNSGRTYDAMDTAPALRTETSAGTPIRKQDATGRMYFMPVWIKSSLGEIELPCAVISLTGKKRIVETALTGRRGTVNELVNVDSYEVAITCALIGEDGNYPEQAVKQMRDLYELNEAVELVSALTDLVFEDEDKVVIESIELPALAGVENIQIVKLAAHTDAAIELIIE